ncbi:MAG TPA: mechanosensitive ion channel family protein [Saprospiraceae bacterium]|nr:mechanosensitive ion channel family protein [Saprospiraceae bacterium]
MDISDVRNIMMNEEIMNSLENMAIFIGIILLTFFIAFIVNRFFRRLIHKSTTIMLNDPTNYQFLRHAITGLIYLIGFSIAIYSLPNLRALASSLLAGAGILAVAVGFASQHALSNIISGVFIVLYKPFRVNNRIEIQNMIGIIEDITLRHTVIRDFQNRRIIIPNSLISEEIILNADFQDDRICKHLELVISFESDLKKAKEIMRDEVSHHPLVIDPRSPKEIEEGIDEVVVRVLNLGPEGVRIRAWAWAKNAADAFQMSCELFESIKLRFDEEKIDIAYPHRVLLNK